MHKENKKKRYHKIGSVAIAAIVLFSVFVMTATSVLLVIQYRKRTIDDYSRQAFSYAKAASVYIDGDKVKEYIKTKKTDKYYEEVDRYLNIQRENSELQYYYIFVPQKNHLMYVWDADTKENESLLGEVERYSEVDEKASFAAFKKNPGEEILITKDDVYGDIGSAYYPIYDSDGEPVALVGVDFIMPDLFNSVRGVLRTIFVSLLLVVAGFTFVFFGFVNHAILHPIRQLSNATKDIVDNLGTDEEYQLDIHTHDEVEELAHSFESMYKEICAYISEVSEVTAEKERIGAELNVATNIQSNMLPRIFPPFPERKEFDIYAKMDPAKEVGGDFYDFFFVDDDHLALVMADVSGKGVPAALFMVIAKTLIKNQAQTGETPKQVLEAVNNQLCENNEADMFVTAWLGIYEISTHTMRAVNAGHEFPAIRRKDEEFELYKDPHGLVLAYVEDFSYKEYEFKLEPGDTLFLYTDGVAEATDASESLYGTDRMLKALNNASKEGADAETLLCEVRKDIDGFVKDAPQFDDITMLAIKINIL